MYRSGKIKGKQAELGLSVAALAVKAGVAPNTVSAIRNGKSVRADSLEKVRKALELSPTDVYELNPATETART